MIYHVHIVGTVYLILQKNMNILPWFSCKLGIHWLPQKRLSDLLKDKEMRTEKVKNNVVLCQFHMKKINKTGLDQTSQSKITVFPKHLLFLFSNPWNKNVTQFMSWALTPSSY